MSIHFNWEDLTANSEEIEQKICDFLHKQFQAITLPPFISSLAVSSFKLGSVPPEVTLKHFSDPFPEFFLDAEAASFEDRAGHDDEDEDAHSTNSTNSNPDEQNYNDTQSAALRAGPGRFEAEIAEEIAENGDATRIEHTLNYALRDNIGETGETGSEMGEPEVGAFDIQTYVELKYAGDMQLAITATLLVNYPAPSFISLPVSIKVTNIDIHSLIVAAFIKRRLYLSILSDLESSNNLKPMENVNVIRSMKIESEIGDNSDHGAVLRNVGKVEKFVLEQLRNIICDELVWPGWLTLEL